MKKIFSFIFLIFVAFFSYAQNISLSASFGKDYYSGNSITALSQKKLYQRNHGLIVGVQRGFVTAIELGMEAHWRKISLRNPNIVGATANFNYNFGKHVIGYQAGAWMKTGRINLTYGGNLLYYSNFKGLHRYGLGPAVGFRLAGFHLTNGINFLAGDNELKGANTLYISLRYYFPRENKFTWDRKTMKKKRERRKEREKRREERNKNDGEEKGLKKLLNL